MLPDEIKTLIKGKFHGLLQENGTGADTLTPAVAWQVFKAFAGTQIEQTHGGLLFECGPVNWGKDEFFKVSFLRFFYLEVEESWDDLMVKLTVSFAPAPELNRFVISISADADAGPNLAAFIEQVEAQQEFWQAVEKRAVHHSEIEIGSQ